MPGDMRYLHGCLPRFCGCLLWQQPVFSLVRVNDHDGRVRCFVSLYAKVWKGCLECGHGRKGKLQLLAFGGVVCLFREETV